MHKPYYILLLLLALTSCTSKQQVNFWGVPIAGDMASFLNAISTTSVITIDEPSVEVDYFTKANGNCTFMGMPMVLTIKAHQITNSNGDPDSEVDVLRLEGVGFSSMPLAEFDKQYGKHKVEGLGNYWDFNDGEIGVGLLGDTLLINFIKYQN